MSLNKSFKTSSKQRNDYIVFASAITAFIICAAFMIIYGDFPKAISVLPDEQRYLDLLRSMATGSPLTVGGEPATYQKIGYPLFLLPAMIFSDAPSQIHAIGVLNSIYIASTVFPTVLIARKLFDTTKPCVIAAFACPVLIYPAMAIGFMSENVSVPLLMWLIYLCICQFSSTGKKAIILSGVIGALFYLAYLVKEMSVLVLAGFIIVLLISIAKDQEKRKPILILVATCLLCFAIPFCIMKFTYFAGMGNSYDQTNLEAFSSLSVLIYGFTWSLPQNLAFAILGFYMVLIFAPIIQYSNMSQQDKRLFLMCLITFVLFQIVITWSISMREGLGLYRSSFHYRYFGFLIIPLFLLFFKYNIAAPSQNKLANKRSIGIVITIACLLVLFFASTGLPNFASEANEFWLTLIANSEIDGTPKEGVIPPGITYVCIYPIGVVLSLLACLMLIAYAYYSFEKELPDRKKLNIVIVGIILLCSVVASAWQMNATKIRYEKSSEDISNAVEMIEETDAIAAEGNDVLVMLTLGDYETDENNNYKNYRPARYKRELMVTYYDNTSQNLKYAEYSDDEIKAFDWSHQGETEPLDIEDYDYLLASEAYDAEVIPDSATKVKSWSFNFAHFDKEPRMEEISLFKLSN